MPVLGRKYRELVQEGAGVEQEAPDTNIVDSGLTLNKKTVKSRLASAKPGIAKTKSGALKSQTGALETSLSGEDGTWLTSAQVQEP